MSVPRKRRLPTWHLLTDEGGKYEFTISVWSISFGRTGACGRGARTELSCCSPRSRMAKAAIWNPVSVTLFVAGVVGICTLLRNSLGHASDRFPFACAMIPVLLVEGAFVSTVWPLIFPYELDFWHAASAERSQMVLLRERS